MPNQRDVQIQTENVLIQNHPLYYWRQRNRYYHQDLEALHRWLIPPRQRILEIGSGTGYLLNALDPVLGVGIDHDLGIVQLAQAQFPHLLFYVQDAHNLKLEAEDPFDYIVLANTVGSLLDVQVVFEQIRAICHPHTRVVITYHNPLWEGILQVASTLKQRMPLPTANWLTQKDIQNLLELSSFEVIKLGKRLLLPRRIPFISTLVNTFLAPLPGINALCLTEYMVARPQALRGLNEGKETTLSCSVIIPARNEAGNIENCVKTLPPLGSHTEIIFVEGHSSDQTWEVMQAVQAQFHETHDIKVLKQEGKGKGDAVRKGFAAATGDVLIILDADLTVQAEDMKKFFQVIASGQCDLANGCRLVYPLSRATMPSLNRWANRFFAGLLSYILGIRIKDSLCGTKALKRQDYLTIAAHREQLGEFDPFGDFDLLLGAVKQNLKIMDIPVRYYPRLYGQSNIQHVREGLLLLKVCYFAAQKFKFHG
jgi:SAM-dependent methyltransferase